MSIWTKLEEALRANINDLLDRATDPIKQLNLMIDDLKDFRAQQVGRIGKAIAGAKMVEAGLNEAKESVSRWGRRAKEAKDDAKAKQSLKQQIQLEKLVATLKVAAKNGQEEVEQLKTELAQLDDKIEYLESQRAIVEVRARTAEAQKAIHGPISGHANAPRADEILDRVDTKIKRMEAEAAGAEEAAKLSAPQTAEGRFGKEELDAEVEKRLADLKAKKEQEKK